MTMLRQSMLDDWTDRSTAAPAPSTVEEASAPASLELAVITTLEGFQALESDWNVLAADAGQSIHVFQGFNWNWHWARHFLSSTRRLSIVTGRRAGRMVMLWPLVTERTHGLHVVAWMGEPVSQYGDVLVESGPESLSLLRQGWAFVVSTLKPDLVRLHKTRADSTIAPLLAQVNPTVTQRLEAPFLDLSSAPTFAAYEDRYTVKARKNRRRLLRRLEEQGPVTVRSYAAGPEASQIAQRAIHMKRVWLAEKGLVSPALSDARTLAFFESIALDTSRPVDIRVSTLTCADELAAVEIAFKCHDRLAIHIMAYDLSYEKAAAGVLLLERLLQTSLETGVATYDLMAPGDGYKKEWADATVGVTDYAVPLTLKGFGYARGWLGFVRPRLKAAIVHVGIVSAQLNRRFGAKSRSATAD
jgi:CelD/BcsL family acetyltransferase involved in cellulose biosynthesis